MSAAGVKRMRGLAVHRAIIIGNTATPLTELERMSAPPDHTHKWTVAVRSAASHPLPTIPGADQLGVPSIGPAAASGSTAVDAAQASSSSAPGATANAVGAAANGPGTAASGGAGMSTRGRDYETDYHKMVGGKDDISHFIKRVQFKLHETYPQSTRNIDKPPFQVTETGWGEFDIQIKIFFVAESGEKPISTFHRLKLHPWHPIAVPAPEAGLAVAADDDQMNVDESITAEQATSAEADATSTAVAEDDAIGQAASDHQADPTPDNAATLPNAEQPLASNGVKAEVTTPAVVHETRSASAAALPFPPRNVPAFVHSWAYDEIVFPEPTEAFYEILTANVPTPLAIQSAQAFSEPSTFRKYKLALEKLNESSGTQGRDIHAQSGILPPHPLYDTSGATFDALSQEAMLAEGQRLDQARQNAVAELEESRRKLIECESRLRQYRPRPAPTST